MLWCGGGGWRPVPAISHCGWAGSALDSVLNAHAWGAAEAPWKRLAVATCPRLSPPSNWSPERLQVAAARRAAAVPPPAQAGDAPWTPAAASLLPGLTPPNIFCGLPDLTLPDARLATGPAPTEPAGRFMACEEPSHADCRQRGCVPPGGPRIRGGEIRGAFKELRRR